MRSKIIIGLVLTLFIVLFIPLYLATEPGRQAAAQDRFKAESVQRGAQIFASNCAVCHGPGGEGGAGPALKGTSLDEKDLDRIISQGISGTPMAAMGEADGGPLNPNQIEDLITFIKNWDQSLLKTTNPPAAVPPVVSSRSAPPSSTATTASSIDAAALFESDCSGCHGKQREGTTGFAPPLDPQSLAELSDEQVETTISGGRPGTGMPAFGQTLSPEEIQALVQFVKHTNP